MHLYVSNRMVCHDHYGSCEIPICGVLPDTRITTFIILVLNLEMLTV